MGCRSCCVYDNYNKKLELLLESRQESRAMLIGWNAIVLSIKHTGRMLESGPSRLLGQGRDFESADLLARDFVADEFFDQFQGLIFIL